MLKSFFLPPAQYGLTYRIGRPVPGACAMIDDLVELLADKIKPASLLLGA